MAFDVVNQGTALANPRVFTVIEPWVPDGFRLDVERNLYVTAGDGVQVFNPQGHLLGKILTPQVAANCSFGMSDNQTLFIGASNSIWSTKLNTYGANNTLL